MGSTVEEACRHAAEDMKSMLDAIRRDDNNWTTHADSFFCPSIPSGGATSSATVATMGVLAQPARANLTRVSQDLYRDGMSGVYVRTFACYQYSYGEEAVVTSDHVFFTSSGSSCQLAVG
jgi:hypothetical protein